MLILPRQRTVPFTACVLAQSFLKLGAQSFPTYVLAPAAAKGKWFMAQLTAVHRNPTAGGGHGFGGTAWEEGYVELSISGLPEPLSKDSSVVVAAESHPARFLP